MSKLRNPSILLSVYFWLIFGISLYFTLVNNKSLNHFAFFFQGFFGSFVLFGVHYYYFYAYNKILKEKHPKVFDKYKLRYSIQKGEIVDGIDFFTKSDVFKALGPKELDEKYPIIIEAEKLSVYSFLLILLLALILAKV